MKKHSCIIWILFLYIFLINEKVSGQNKYTPAQENLAARALFQNARFGMFIHWGVYSVLGDGEWVMEQQKIPLKNYEKLSGAFNPTQFDPVAIVDAAKSAGMKYITITSKHHDGFAMYDSKVSDYDIIDRTPYKKDVLKLLANECQKQGIKLFFYYSHLDWHHPDYFPRGYTSQWGTGRPENGDFNKYVDYMNAQLTELLTNYGPVAGIWFDGWWDQKIKGRETKINWRLEETYALIHKLQPACLVGNNHHVEPFEGEDFQMFEKDLPGRNTTGFSADSKIGSLPLEICETMNSAWGFNIQDNNYKSTRELIGYLVTAAGYNSNFLLNIGPMSNGVVQPEFVKTLSEIGKWTDRFGETIYGTRGGPIEPREWGVTTQKGNKIYVHILKWNDKSISIPPVNKKIKSAKLFSSKSKITFTQNDDSIILKLPEIKSEDYDTIVELEF